MAGYSGTPLVKKLGITAGSKLLVVAEPPSFQSALGELPPNVERTSAIENAKARRVDVAVVFVLQRRELERHFLRVTPRMTSAGGVWIAWPKKTSKIPTDMTEDIVRAVVLPTGWVDNKVCAIDATWSGLRFVQRKELRRPRRRRGSGKPEPCS